MVAYYEDGAEPAFGTSPCSCLRRQQSPGLMCLTHLILFLEDEKVIFNFFCSSVHGLPLILLCCAIQGSHHCFAWGTKRSSLEEL